MRILRAEAFLAAIPLRMEVRHALASRGETRNVFVRLEDETGLEGWGEGVPREYVTGESAEGAFATLADTVLPRLCGLGAEGPDEVPAVFDGSFPLRPGTQAARCAAELAFLDLAGRCWTRSAADWFGGPRRETLDYGAVIPIVETGRMAPLLLAVREGGLRHVKIKAEGEEVVEAIAEARRVLGSGVTLCVDANGSWDLETAVRIARRLEPFAVSWIEQPLPRGKEGDVPRLAALARIPLMADESLTGPDDARRLIEAGGYGLFNIRLSKLGGMGPSLEVAGMASAAGLRVQVGCQVGETAVLSAAGRLAASVLPEVAAVEGSYGERLLAEDVAAEPFLFGEGGRTRLQGGVGLGIRVLRRKLEPFVTRKASCGYGGDGRGVTPGGAGRPGRAGSP